MAWMRSMACSTLHFQHAHVSLSSKQKRSACKSVLVTKCDTNTRKILVQIIKRLLILKPRQWSSKYCGSQHVHIPMWNLGNEGISTADPGVFILSLPLLGWPGLFFETSVNNTRACCASFSASLCSKTECSAELPPTAAMCKLYST